MSARAGVDLYRNGGLSPVITFRYGDPCIAPVFLSSDNISEQTADLSWNSTALATGYQVRFRENGTDLSDWYEEPATQTTYTVKNLKPDCTYEYQVQSECGSLPSDYSVSGTLKTKKLENQNQSCSEQLDNANMPTNRDPLSALHTNQTFLAGVMPVKVTSVQGSNGIFTGTGEVYLPIAGVGLSCTFNKVGINTTYQLISGEVITTKSKNTTIYGSGGVTVLDTLHLDNPIDTIIVNPNGDVAVVSGGDTTFIPLANQPVVIYPPTGGGAGTTTGDNTGNGGGDGAGAGGSTGGGGTTTYGDGPLIVENGTVKPYNPAGDLPTALFHKASMSTYGYDSLAYEALRSYYPVATINGKEVGIPYKALPVSGSDNVVLELKPGSSKLTTDSLTIDVQTNAKVASKSVMGNNKLMVTLEGLSEGEEPIIVRYTKHDADGKTEQVDIGAAKAVVYQPQPMKLVVVPLAGTTAPDASALQSQLTAIYGQAVTSWAVTVTSPFAYTIPGGQLEFGSSEMASSYTEGMNNLIDAYKVANPTLEDGTYYLFVVPRFSDATLQGYMPRARRFGFIAQSSTDARTLAHELGHGAFNLSHTFPVLPQGTTDNLMDYNGGTRLIKPQWDLIHNPELTTGLLDDETDGASISDFRAQHPTFTGCGDTPPLVPDYLTYLTPSGLPITLPKQACQVTFSGVLYGAISPEKLYISKNVVSSFAYDGNIYVAESDGKNFLGYYRIHLNRNKQYEDPYYDDTYTLNNLNNLKVLLPGMDCFSGELTKFDNLNGIKGPYHASGKLITICPYCQKPGCGGECRIICHKCLQPILKCYCGRACICYAERFSDGPFTGCDFNRHFGNIGIPFWDENGNLSIQKFSTGTDEQSILHNLVLDSQGLKLFFQKLGLEAPASPENVVEAVADYTQFLEDGGMASDAVKRFNNMYSTYNTLNNINNALLNQDFLKGLYEAVKSIPYLNKYISGIETLFSIVQSQEFNASLMDKVENDRTVLGRYNQNDPNVQRERNDLLKVKKFAKENLDAIKQQNIDSIHERICTCPK